MNNKLALESLAMDLKRVAVGYQRNSLTMGQRFYEEALKRKNEVDISLVKPYIQTLLERIDSLQGKSNEDIAEEALLMSILLQNYVQKN